MGEMHLQWAEETFGRVRLGDERLSNRLVKIATAVAAQPGGTVTSTMPTSAEKEGAFRFLENQRVDACAVGDAVYEATAINCASERRVFVAVDQTDLTFVDRKQLRGLGPDSTRMCPTLSSTQVMNSLALDETGVAIGLLDQQWWLRPQERAPHWKQDKRPAEERESWNWIRATEASSRQLHRAAPGCQPWFLCDRGADMSALLKKAVDQNWLVTVRASHDRALDRGGRRAHLFSTMRRQPSQGRVEIHVPRSEKRLARVATCEVRVLPAARVRLGRSTYRRLTAVQLREVGHKPIGQELISWTLWTTFPVQTLQDALTVIRGYTFRWRIEEVHRTWKSGACNVERSQLRSYEAIRRWATILAAVSTRIERLKRLSREQPDLDALTELSRDEIDAAIMLTKTKRWTVGDSMNLKEAVRLVAMVGGYMGRKGDGPPGSITLRRGLDRVAPAAEVMAAQRSD